MKMDFAARVDIGKKETNDDRAFAAGMMLETGACSGRIGIPSVVTVCDGCGGYAGGYIAAQTVLERLSREAPGRLSDPAVLARVLDDCQAAVLEKKKEMPHFAEMCTTIAGCVFCSDNTLFFHAGDSRVYRYDRWGIAKMTRDHSVIQTMIDLGEITPEEAKEHPRRNVISRCIGFEGEPPEIYSSGVPAAPGEKYLFCSDGLWESVGDAQLEAMLGRDIPLRQMADELVQTALAQGSDDNISVCICAVRDD